MKKGTLLCLWCWLIISYASPVKSMAQDPHFSQYFSSPLTFNPAFTGYFDGKQRLALTYRNQWANTGDPYTTATVSFDSRILQGHIGSNDRWGLGVHALYDQSAGGIFKNQYLSLSTGFNKGLDAEGDQSIGIGIQATMARNSIDFSRIYYNSQFAGSGFDISIPSGESINDRSVSYMDLNAGLLYNFKDERGNHFAFGTAMYHIMKPKLSYFSNTDLGIASRYTAHASANLFVNETDNLFFSSHIMMQGGAAEYVVGSAYGFSLGDTGNDLYLGAWWRIADAWYPYAGWRTQDFQLGLSYDISHSDLKRQQKWAGSLEPSFQYFFTPGVRKKGIPCFF